MNSLGKEILKSFQFSGHKTIIRDQHFDAHASEFNDSFCGNEGTVMDIILVCFFCIFTPFLYIFILFTDMVQKSSSKMAKTWTTFK